MHALTMTWDNYQQLAHRTEKPFPLMIQRLQHAQLGVASETGELTGTIKKTLIYGAAFDVRNAKEETGDILWYLAILANALGFRLADAAANKPPYDLGKAAEPGEALLFVQYILNRESGALAGGVHLIAEQIISRDNWLNITATIFGALHYLGSMHGYTLTECAIENIVKLKERYPENYSDSDALARADKRNLSGFGLPCPQCGGLDHWAKTAQMCREVWRVSGEEST